jgi:hypothetical protein
MQGRGHRWEPFVAFIVGSYDLRLPSPHSKLQAFVVRTQQGQPTPMEITFGTPQQAPSTLGDDTLQVRETRGGACNWKRATGELGRRALLMRATGELGRRALLMRAAELRTGHTCELCGGGVEMWSCHTCESSTFCAAIWDTPLRGILHAAYRQRVARWPPMQLSARSPWCGKCSLRATQAASSSTTAWGHL